MHAHGSDDFNNPFLKTLYKKRSAGQINLVFSTLSKRLKFDFEHPGLTNPTLYDELPSFVLSTIDKEVLTNEKLFIRSKAIVESLMQTCFKIGYETCISQSIDISKNLYGRKFMFLTLKSITMSPKLSSNFRVQRELYVYWLEFHGIEKAHLYLSGEKKPHFDLVKIDELLKNPTERKNVEKYFNEKANPWFLNILSSLYWKLGDPKYSLKLSKMIKSDIPVFQALKLLNSSIACRLSNQPFQDVQRMNDLMGKLDQFPPLVAWLFVTEFLYRSSSKVVSERGPRIIAETKRRVRYSADPAVLDLISLSEKIALKKSESFDEMKFKWTNSERSKVPFGKLYVFDLVSELKNNQ